MAPIPTTDTKIAGTFSAKDWTKRKSELKKKQSEEWWATTFDSFLMARLNERYLRPIKILQTNGQFKGEGFTIVSIQCALIEFLAALKVGKTYRYLKKGQKLQKFEYASSNKLFCDFLTTEEPFKKWFNSNKEAREFYTNVRCGLLHEARTKNDWRIWATGKRGVDSQNKLVKRDALQSGINDYLQAYGKLLASDQTTQDAFIRKFDDLTS